MAKKLIMMSVLTLLGIGSAAQSMKKAKAYFKSGNFSQAKNEYLHIIDKQPQNGKALIYLGYILLMQNKLDEAESWLLKASKIKPNFATINNFLAEIYYRRNDFDKAAVYFRAIGREGLALKLARFKNQTPYQVDKQFDEVRIQFIVTNPLPFVKVIINQQYEGNFILDTGAGELILDENFAREAGAEIFGKPEISDFGGGKKATISHGKISSIQLGRFTVKNIPVQLLQLRHIELEGMKIDGVIGTIFLSQFLSTIDYKNGDLVLRNKHTHFPDQLSANALNASLIPFSIAGDHYMLAKGSINDSDTMLFFIDTGLGNTAFTCPASTVKKLKLPLQKNKRSSGQGGGGHYDIYPFHIEKLCLGNICVSNLHGQYGPFPKTLENSFGFKIDGLLSHEFFLNKALTIDFESMKYLISE
ncbi:tetratricopeptide repeat protein [Niastella caeni]|uniref:Tetratricopeptide repeat protein n=1 Tax=Niastella caeni TaxID=2569763 RepID=A0A4V4H0Y3_9BACT|nr:aspartyl protease family protein [Niastella caeni]THU38306.1 tetratricopeptide repeat protein [Niastella caeni]